MHDVTKRPNKFLRRKQVGKCLISLEEYEYDDQKRYYIEANGPDFRIWKRVKEDYHRAFEIYIMYRFWVWWIEACCNWLPATRFITWVMLKVI